MQQVQTLTGRRVATRSASNSAVSIGVTIGIRFALYVDLMLLFGLPLFGLYALRGAERFQSAVLPIRAFVLWLAASAICLSVLSIVAMTASMAGVSIGEVDRASVGTMITQTPMGIAWQVRIATLFIAICVAVAVGARGKPVWLVIVCLGSATALASLAWTGHGAATDGFAGARHLTADVVHLLAAGGWLGALAALATLLFQPLSSRTESQLRLLHRILHEFSLVGAIIVALIFVSGLVNSWVLVGPTHLLSMTGTLYGQLLLAKLVLFAAMLVLAAINRFRLTPAIDHAIQAGETFGAVQRLRKSLFMETGAAIAIIGLVAWLGTLEPPMSM